MIPEAGNKKRSAVAAALPITFNRNDYLPESF